MSLVPFRRIRQSPHFQKAALRATDICPPLAHAAGRKVSALPSVPTNLNATIPAERLACDFFSKRAVLDEACLKQEPIAYLVYTKNQQQYKLYRQLSEGLSVPLRGFPPPTLSQRAYWLAEAMAFKGLDAILSKRNKLDQHFVSLTISQNSVSDRYVQAVVEQFWPELKSLHLTSSQSAQELARMDLDGLGFVLAEIKVMLEAHGKRAVDLLILDCVNSQSYGCNSRQEQLSHLEILAAEVLLLLSLLAPQQNAIIRLQHNFFQRSNEIVFLLTSLFASATLLRPSSLPYPSNGMYLVLLKFDPASKQVATHYLERVLRNRQFLMDQNVALVDRRRMAEYFQRVCRFNMFYVKAWLLPVWQRLSSGQRLQPLATPTNPKQIFDDLLIKG